MDPSEAGLLAGRESVRETIIPDRSPPSLVVLDHDFLKLFPTFEIYNFE